MLELVDGGTGGNISVGNAESIPGFGSNNAYLSMSEADDHAKSVLGRGANDEFNAFSQSVTLFARFRYTAAPPDGWHGLGRREYTSAEKGFALQIAGHNDPVQWRAVISQNGSSGAATVPFTFTPEVGRWYDYTVAFDGTTGVARVTLYDTASEELVGSNDDGTNLGLSGVDRKVARAATPHRVARFQTGFAHADAPVATCRYP